MNTAADRNPLVQFGSLEPGALFTSPDMGQNALKKVSDTQAVYANGTMGLYTFGSHELVRLQLPA